MVCRRHDLRGNVWPSFCDLWSVNTDGGSVFLFLFSFWSLPSLFLGFILFLSLSPLLYWWFVFPYVIRSFLFSSLLSLTLFNLSFIPFVIISFSSLIFSSYSAFLLLFIFFYLPPFYLLLLPLLLIFSYCQYFLLLLCYSCLFTFSLLPLYLLNLIFLPLSLISFSSSFLAPLFSPLGLLFTLFPLLFFPLLSSHLQLILVILILHFR